MRRDYNDLLAPVVHSITRSTDGRLGLDESEKIEAISHSCPDVVDLEAISGFVGTRYTREGAL